MRFWLLGLLLLMCVAALLLGLHLSSATVSPPLAALHADVWQRIVARDAIPAELNGYPALDKLLTGNTPQKRAAKALSETFATDKVPSGSALAQFEEVKGPLDAALAKKYLAWPSDIRTGGLNNSNQLDRTLLLRSLALTYRVYGERVGSVDKALASYRRAWLLGSQCLEQEGILDFMLGTAMLNIAMEPMQDLVASGRLSQRQLRELDQFIQGHRARPEALAHATDYDNLQMNVMMGLQKKGQLQYPKGTPASGPPNLLEKAVLDQQVRGSNALYLRYRPCLVDMVPFASRGLNLQKDANWLNLFASMSLPNYEAAMLQYRMTLDEQDILLSALAIQSSRTPPKSPRVTFDRATRTLVLDAADYSNPRRTRLKLK